MQIWVSLRELLIRGGTFSAVNAVTLHGLESTTGDHRSDCHTNCNNNNNNNNMEKLSETCQLLFSLTPHHWHQQHFLRFNPWAKVSPYCWVPRQRQGRLRESQVTAAALPLPTHSRAFVLCFSYLTWQTGNAAVGPGRGSCPPWSTSPAGSSIPARAGAVPFHRQSSASPGWKLGEGREEAARAIFTCNFFK